MKKISYYASMAALMLFASCSSDVEDFVDENKISDGETITIGVSMPGAEGTRVSIDDIQGMLWEKGDRIKAFGYDASDAVCGYQPFDIDVNYKGGSASALFTGKPVKGAVKHVFYYLGKNYMFDLEYGTDKCDYLGQVQNGLNTPSHIKSYLRLQSPIVENYNSVTLSPYNSVLKINLQDLPAEIKDASKITIKFFVNYGEAEEHLNAKVDLYGTVAPDVDNFVYMIFDPSVENDLISGKKLGLEFVTETHTCKASVLSQNGKDYQSGKIYNVAVNYGAAGSWTWEVVSNAEKMPLLYEEVFNSEAAVATWTQEGDIKNLISFMDNFMVMTVSDTFAYNDGTTSYAVSPSEGVQLASTKNVVSFTHKFTGLTYVNPVDALSLVVREVGTTEWTNIPLPSYPANGVLENTGEIEIPAQFKGLKVQFGFKNIIKMMSFSHAWYVQDFVVRGK